MSFKTDLLRTANLLKKAIVAAAICVVEAVAETRQVAEAVDVEHQEVLRLNHIKISVTERPPKDIIRLRPNKRVLLRYPKSLNLVGRRDLKTRDRLEVADETIVVRPTIEIGPPQAVLHSNAFHCTHASTLTLLLRMTCWGLSSYKLFDIVE